MKPLVSVIIPAFNVEKYVYEAISSILQQTYENLEIIVVDDGSTDNTVSVCKNIVSIDNRVKLYQNETNLGIAETLNYAISISAGTYIVRMDADDVSFPNRIDEMYDFLNNSDVDIVGTGTITINEAGDEVGRYMPIEKHEDILKTLKYASPLLHIWMCKKSLYKEVGLYRFPPVEDYDFLLRCIKKNFKLHNIQKPLYKVRIRGGNTVDLYGFKQLKSFEVAYRNYLDDEVKLLSSSSMMVERFNQFFYEKSRVLLLKGSSYWKGGNMLFSFMYFFLSALISQYQFRYLYRRLSLFLYKKKNKL
ncbi:glycosyltransferase family 2 protein [Shewanella sp. AS16]|uniref:glycosyltransferase family 2 protein n=1 Tax=Shewanella sp. AS16 TaxID=2907625 RepID=UPI001F3083ED|nr:glycosyltransferase family 2 protein [Shewanella sp. AS16]MCE9686733.1 glycosyltransferase family 2 protein [Shewanella sp. AS16]